MKRPMLIFTICFAIALSSLTSVTGKTQSRRVIEITASRFAFTPNEITIKKGEQVTLEVQSKDVDHGLEIEELGVRIEVKKGSPTNVKLNPTSEGTFEGKCAHFCGTGHGSMTFTVHVVE